MRFSDFFRMGFINLRRRKVRTILTAAAMAVGVACIVVLISIGIGYNQTYQESISEMGSLTKIDVTPQRETKGKVALLNDKAVSAFKKLNGVRAVTPVVQVVPYLKSGKYVAPIRLYGIDLTTAESFQIIPLKGELPLKGTKLVPQIILTDDVADSFADPQTWEQIKDMKNKPLIDPMNGNIKLTFDYNTLSGQYTEGEDGRAVPSGNIYRIEVTGITSMQNYTYSTSGFIQLKILEELIEGNTDFLPPSNTANDMKNIKTYPLVWIKADDIKNVQGITDVIRKAGFETYSLNDMLESVKKQSRQIQGMLAAIGAVALLVAGIGTANTMMMAINERTKEIGILKVLGTDLGDIVKMFLVESAIIGVIGGTIGLFVSFILQRLLPVLLQEMEVRSIIPIWLAGGAVIFAVFVAVISALGPAINAMRVSPQVAIRAE